MKIVPEKCFWKLIPFWDRCGKFISVYSFFVSFYTRSGAIIWMVEKRLSVNGLAICKIWKPISSWGTVSDKTSQHPLSIQHCCLSQDWSWVNTHSLVRGLCRTLSNICFAKSSIVIKESNIYILQWIFGKKIKLLWDFLRW